MHFWIDKRSQACTFNGRHGVPASLASGRRRRNKSMVTPVHRFQSIESSTVAQQLRRPYQQHMLQSRSETNQSSGQCQSPVLSGEPVSGSIISRPTPSPALDTPVYIDSPIEGALDTMPHAQLMRLGGLTKYGMWASFGLTTISVAATKFYVDHQGTFEILLLCTLGVLSAGLFVSCVLTVCKKTHPPQFITVQRPQTEIAAIEMEIPEVLPERELIITPMSSTVQQQTPTESRPIQDFEQPPPPYHIAILLPLKENACADFPPPTYENAVR